MSKNRGSDRYRKGDHYHNIMMITLMMRMIAIMAMMITIIMMMNTKMMMMIAIMMRIITIVMKPTNPGDFRVWCSQHRLLQARCCLLFSRRGMLCPGAVFSGAVFSGALLFRCYFLGALLCSLGSSSALFLTDFV